MSIQCTLYIGRDEATSRLGIFLSPTKKKLLDQVAPNTISRYKPQEQTAHCKIEVYKDGQLKLYNLNPQNYTFADGQLIEKAWITPDSHVELGYNHFPIEIGKILQDIGYKRTYHIDHLQNIHQQYQDKLEKIQLNQAKDQAKQRLQGICSLLGMALAIMPFEKLGLHQDSVNIVRFSCVGAALLLGLYFLFRSMNPKNTFIMRKKEVDNWLKEHYRCPNPQCQAPFKASHDYQTLKAMGQCPMCKCRLSESQPYVNRHKPGTSGQSLGPIQYAY